MTSLRQLLFIHGAIDDSDDPNSVMPGLDQDLAGIFTVSRPRLPEPDAKIWGDRIEEYLGGLAEDAVLVGHSFGGSMILKVIAERRTCLRAGGLVLMSPPWWGPEGWGVDDFALPAEFASALSGLGSIVHMHGRADEVVSFAHQALYALELPDAQFVALDKGTHDFADEGHAAVVDEIKSL